MHSALARPQMGKQTGSITLSGPGIQAVAHMVEQQGQMARIYEH